MPFSNATQPQLEELLASLRTVTQRLQRAAQGSYPAPLDPTPRLALANLSTRLAEALRALEVIGEPGTPLGPNDIIIDKTLPVPVYDDASGVSGTGVVAMRDGLPVVDLTESSEVALVQTGTKLWVAPTGQAMTQFQGTIQLAAGTPRSVSLASKWAILEKTAPMNLRSYSASGGQSYADAMCHLDVSIGKLFCAAPAYVALVESGSTVQVADGSMWKFTVAGGKITEVVSAG